MDTLRFSLLYIPFDIHSGKQEGCAYVFDDESRTQIINCLEEVYQGRLLWIRGDTKTILNTPLGIRYLSFLGYSGSAYYPVGLDLSPKCSLPKVSNDKRLPASQGKQVDGNKMPSGVRSATTGRMWWRNLLGTGEKT